MPHNPPTMEKAFNLLRALPRVCLANLKDHNWRKTTKRGRAQHGGDKHGAGNKGGGQRQNFMRIGYETGNNPFYKRFPCENYYRGQHLKRQYPPLSMLDLQKMIDTNRIDITKPIDLVAIANTGLYRMFPDQHHFGVNLTDEGADIFCAKVNLEVQWTNDLVIAAVERCGGIPIPRRMIPPPDAIEFYTDPAKRGYLADPEKISQERLVLAQKYGYELPRIEDDPDYEMLTERKDPRQIFYGLEPGWVVNLRDKVILKPLEEELLKYYNS
ncbi:hypothetical protein NQ315_015836 [Exocentrus adspersus]|uniref:Large ribosomal subunit protein uL15m n=1 Tax=Exocentrus adspersus TaxID=1586481 RepID=A0AAV8W382_9CUCU|nr:hypothetical protein NQ315_015836 [Exocentrus adspersus]